MSVAMSDVAVEKPGDPSLKTKRSNPGGGYYTICFGHDTVIPGKRTCCVWNDRGAMTHSEFGEVRVSNVGHSPICASDAA